MKWKKLKREDSHEVLDKLKSRSDAVVFSKSSTEVLVCNLSFYEEFKLYKLTNYMTLPCFVMYYLSNGTDFYAMDGTASQIYKVNDLEFMNLNTDNIIQYVDFVFENAEGDDGDIFLIHQPENPNFMKSMSEAYRKNVIEHYHPIQIKEDEINRVFLVHGTLYYGHSLISATIQITKKGIITVKNQKLLLKGVHMPNEADQYSWISGEKL